MFELHQGTLPAPEMLLYPSVSLWFLSQGAELC